jgi:VanZ family protein
LNDSIKSPFQRTARWLLLVAAVLILYGSLYPFRFDVNRDVPFMALVKALSFEHTSRGDSVANVLLYIPFGFFFVVALSRNWHAVFRFTPAVLAGALLSVGLESLQALEPARVASLTDSALNTVSTAIGALAALIGQYLGMRLRPGFFENRPHPVPLGFILLWLSSRLAPFVPALDWQKIKNSLKPILLTPELNTFHAARYLVGWLVVAYAVRRLWKPTHALPVLLVMVLGTQCGRILIDGKTLNLSELVGVAGMFLLLPLLARTTPANRLLFLTGALAAIVVATGLEPWQFTSEPSSFHWLPFAGSLGGSYEYNLVVLIEKCFWYGALLWLLNQRTRALLVPTLAIAALVGSLEVAQMWLPGRTAEITDPLIVLLVGGSLEFAAQGARLRASRRRASDA